MQSPQEDLIDFFDQPPFPLLLPKRESSVSQMDELENFSGHVFLEQKQNITKRMPKVQKNKKIRTNRNVQKIYHNILKNWLEQQKYSRILVKYNPYYNQRVYFILVLNQIIKHIDGKTFLPAYQQLAKEVITHKLKQIQIMDKEKPNSEQALHLRRVIEEIQYSVRACAEFIDGNTMEALVIVYKRNQDRITKIKDFERALQIFEEVTGHSRNYL